MSEKVKVTVEKSTDLLHLPAIALRGLVVFPNNVIHFEVGRKRSVEAIEWAIANSSEVFLSAQIDMDVEEPGAKEMYNVGVVAEIKQVLRVSEDLVKVLVEGKYRAKMVNVDTTGKFLVATVKPYSVRGIRAADSSRAEALLRSIKEQFEEYLALNPRLPKDVVFTIVTNDDPVYLSEYIPAHLLFKYQDKQMILQESSAITRLEKLHTLLQHENEVLGIERDIQDKVNNQMDKNQRDYYLREQMHAISDELGDYDDTAKEAESYKSRIQALQLDEETTDKLLKEADRLEKMPGMSQEAAVSRAYLDICLDLPWHTSTKESINVKKAQTQLDKDHYGLKKVKERILELLAVRQLSPEIKGQTICLVGPPGVGKTSIARSIAECLNRKYVRMSLGGVHDEAEIRGHRRTYIGSMPGKVISAIQTAKSNNPLILMDEVDKMASDFRGDPASALLEALDPEQNSTFKDHYLDIPFDLSNVLFITTANSLSTIPQPLLDRMDIIELPSYTREEKFHIAKLHLLPKELTNNGMKGKVRMTDAALYCVIDHYTQEAGVRTLQRTIAEILRKCAKQIASGEEELVRVTPVKVESLLGPYRVKPSFFNRTNEVGITNGLAWTSIGGEILPIEVQVVENGTGKVELTGSLGDVMKESAKLAVTYAKAHAAQYGYEASLFKTADIHIHAPEGATPKDGPSAGVTLTTSLISCLSNLPVRADIAMTGEISLHGMVLPIGGLREKSMAAYREGMKKVLIPAGNVPDLYEVDPVVKEAVAFVPVNNLQEVLDAALIRETPVQKKQKSPKQQKGILPIKSEEHPVTIRQ